MEHIKIINQQKTFFDSGRTRDLSYIKDKLKALKTNILSNEEAIYEALYKDFKKSRFEAYFSEIGIVVAEIDMTLKNLKSWSKPNKVRAAALNFPSKDYIYSEPYGAVLIIAPWNYPFQLAIAPVISAIAAGNTVVLKPSELTPHTAKIIETILSEVFQNEHLSIIQGGIPETTALLNERWDYIFFTGSVPVGKIVAKAAAQYMTPVTLELGGKNPCIVDDSVNIKLVAKRLVWGKFVNAGQTCIAPDYILAEKSIKSELIQQLKIEITKAYGEEPKKSTDYPRIVNTKNLKRLSAMLKGVDVVHGGDVDEEDDYIAPTLVDNPSLKSKLMEGEIFGPILPVFSYETMEDIELMVSRYEKPLGFYVFSNRKQFYNTLIKKYSFGGGSVNDTMVHFGNPRLPFGGVGESGIGAYHGRLGFDTFSHKKGITIKANWLDIPLRYAPYTNKLKKIKKAFKWLG
ncbi:MAG: aldehyde dehydrogenase [Bacteroidetes bacterium]|nr:aldehyde dehydrogenase [Bacteroidota bacterium]